MYDIIETRKANVGYKMTICINEKILNDDNIKAQNIHTLLQLMKIAKKEADNIFIAVFSLKERMELVKCNNCNYKL